LQRRHVGRCYLEPSSDWVSATIARFGSRLGVEQMSGTEAELAVEGGAADMEQENSTPAGPTHLPRRFRNGKYRLSLINDDGT
jgi:hypothetical protein